MCIWWEVEGWEGEVSEDTRFQSNCHTLRTKLEHVIVITNDFFSGLAQLTCKWWPGCSRSVTIGYNEDMSPGDKVTLLSLELLLCALLYHQVHHTLIKDKIKDLCSPVSSSWSKTHQRQNQWQRRQCLEQTCTLQPDLQHFKRVWEEHVWEASTATSKNLSLDFH